jgi:hypothetical protein
MEMDKFSTGKLEGSAALNASANFNPVASSRVIGGDPVETVTTKEHHIPSLSRKGVV